MEPIQDNQSRPTYCKSDCKTISDIFKMPSDGALLALWLGMVLLMSTFAIKQVMVSWTLTTVSDALEIPRLQAKQQAELEDVGGDSSERFGPFRDRDQGLDKSDQQREERAKQRTDINKKYDIAIEKARKDMRWSAASGLHKAQWTLLLKMVLDLAKIVAYALILFASLRIVTDPVTSGTLKVYATVLGGITFLTCVLGGLIAYLS